MTFSDLRQLFYPKHFRIRSPNWTLDLLMPRLGRAEVATKNEAAQGLNFKQQCKLFADIATQSWQLRQRMIDPRTGAPKHDMRKAFHHIVSIMDTLSEAGVQIQDHTGKPYRPGLAVQTLAFQPTGEVTRETIIETVRPSVYLNAKQIQQGQVIVGKPLEKE